MQRISNPKQKPFLSKDKEGFLYGPGFPQETLCILSRATGAALNKKKYNEKYRKNNKLKTIAYRKKYYKKNGLKEFLSQKISGSAKARRIIYKAIKLGHLPSLSKYIIKCTDCPQRANRYDHRNYNFPLYVSPVCIACNKKRGPAIPMQSPATFFK